MPSHVRLYGEGVFKVNFDGEVEATHIGLNDGAKAEEKVGTIVEHIRELGHTAIIPHSKPEDSFSPVDVLIAPPMPEEELAQVCDLAEVDLVHAPSQEEIAA